MGRKTYILKLTTLGPVHIGDGKTARTKEYVYLDNGSAIYFPEMGKLFQSLSESQKLDFENYLMGNEKYGTTNRNERLGEWLKKNRICRTGDWGGYCISMGNSATKGDRGSPSKKSLVIEGGQCAYLSEAGTRCRNHARENSLFCGIHADAPAVADTGQVEMVSQRQIFIPDSQKHKQLYRMNDINTCIKDAWGMPYRPGSTLKGLLRSLFIAWKQEDVITKVNEYTPTSDKTKRARYQPQIINPEEGITSDRSLTTDDKDIFQFISVSDSRPLKTSDLILCKKIDRLNRTKSTKFGSTQESTPALDRECVCPGVDIEFTVTCLDERFLDLLTNLDAVIAKYNIQCIESIKKRFDSFGVAKVLDWQTQGVYVGGGTGFHTKTVAMTNNVRANILDWKFDQTGRTSKHSRNSGGGVFRHYFGPFAAPLENRGIDDLYGWPSTFTDSVEGQLQSSAPRVYKLTKVGNKYYEMGKCQISIEEER